MQVVVGRVGRPHGIRGEVTVHVTTDAPEQRFAPGSTFAAQTPDGGSAGDRAPGRDPLTVVGARWQSGRLLVAFGGVTDRSAAEELRGIWLMIDTADTPSPADPDEFHDAELIGLDVVTTDGHRVGTVTDVLHHGQDRLVVHGVDAAEILVPFVRALVPDVDLGAGHVVIDPPPGLLDTGGTAPS